MIVYFGVVTTSMLHQRMQCCFFLCSGDCSPGYWCVHGVDRPNPDGTNQSQPLNNSCYDDRQLGLGGRCPVGHYCPGGLASVFPIPCENGTYADVEGLPSCNSCPEGEKIFPIFRTILHAVPGFCWMILPIYTVFHLKFDMWKYRFWSNRKAMKFSNFIPTLQLFFYKKQKKNVSSCSNDKCSLSLFSTLRIFLSGWNSQLHG